MVKNKKPIRIALSGRMGSGKSYYVERLIEEYGGVRLSFAAPIKDLYSQYADRRRMGEDDLEKRHFCQVVGEGVRSLDSEFWVGNFLDRLSDEDGPVFVDDARYPNEVRALEDAGFRVIRIVSSDEIRLRKLPTATRAVDTVSESETALDNYKFTYVFYNYYNEASEKDFWAVVKAALRGE